MSITRNIRRARRIRIHWGPSARALEDADLAVYPVVNLYTAGQPRFEMFETEGGAREISTIAGSRSDPPHRTGGKVGRRHHYPRHRQRKANGGRNHSRRARR